MYNNEEVSQQRSMATHEKEFSIKMKAHNSGEAIMYSWSQYTSSTHILVILPAKKKSWKKDPFFSMCVCVCSETTNADVFW